MNAAPTYATLQTMPTANPFANPITARIVSIDPTKAIAVIFLLIAAVWLIYTIVAGYHLFRYGHKSSVSIPAVLLHIFISAAFFLYALSGFASLHNIWKNLN